jgi:hypothetical protein
MSAEKLLDTSDVLVGPAIGMQPDFRLAAFPQRIQRHRAFVETHRLYRVGHHQHVQAQAVFGGEVASGHQFS